MAVDQASPETPGAHQSPRRYVWNGRGLIDVESVRVVSLGTLLPTSPCNFGDVQLHISGDCSTCVIGNSRQGCFAPKLRHCERCATRAPHLLFMAHDFELDETDPSAPARDALILYATETGTAEDAARRLARRLRARAFHVRVVSADAYPPVRTP
jgi:hypothetical protein